MNQKSSFPADDERPFIMIRRLSKISENLVEERSNSTEGLKRMQEASCGQSPDLLIIPSIRRGMQDVQLLGIKQGEAFFATRIPKYPILASESSLIFVASPAAYNCKFPCNRGIVLSFELDESDELVRRSIEALSSYPGIGELPIAAFRVNYESGLGSIIAHERARHYGFENDLLSRFSAPEPLDDSLLVILCSDSRLQPPRTSKGASMSIRTLGGYVPPFSGRGDETNQLNDFLSNWFSSRPEEKRILVMAHGSFEGDGPSCGAGTASLTPTEHPSNLLESAIHQIAKAAMQFEAAPAATPETRVLSIAKATKRNLFRYPALCSLAEQHIELEEIVDIALMDTVTNVITEME